MAVELEAIRESVRAMKEYRDELTRPERPQLWCTGCLTRVYVRKASGKEIYPHRPDLAHLNFWACGMCGAYVGTHHKTNDPDRPLGVLATPELRIGRQQIHAILDPLWQTGAIDRREAYAFIKERFGRTYHTAGLYSLAEGKKVYRIVKELRKSLEGKVKAPDGPWNR